MAGMRESEMTHVVRKSDLKKNVQLQKLLALADKKILILLLLTYRFVSNT